MKPCRGPLSPANYVETSKTIKHLVVFLPRFNFSQYCDRGKYCAFPRVVAVKRSKSKGQGRANRWIYNFLFIYSFPIVSLEVFLQGCILRSLFSLHSAWIPFLPLEKKIKKYHPNCQIYDSLLLVGLSPPGASRNLSLRFIITPWTQIKGGVHTSRNETSHVISFLERGDGNGPCD